MDIIQIRRNERLKRIKSMEHAIKKAKNPDFDRLVLLCCSEWGISERTSKELLKIARFNISNAKS